MKYSVFAASEQNTTGGVGTLQVNAFVNTIARPAEGATVRIYDATHNATLEELTTDAAGQLPPVNLPAPPLDYSMSPDQPRPFNEYSLHVKLEGTQQVVINNVQVYPDSVAVQNVVLRPTYQIIDIPYPVLWGDYPPKIPEAEIKPITPTNLVVLPKPVVPEFVVVHAGRPNDRTAPNYTVGFKDYIKNVASSEIYATWPVEALKANILAMLSFTLNRVYTEWYRGKGYDFTVTNSTAFDQAFTYGRNIFREISEVVDDIFTTYIAKPDVLQPLFTQYSDGRKVVRDGWLSQWGAKGLADQGLTALQILRNYYGRDIELRQAEKVEGIPLSFPGEVLGIGSSGDAVRTIQEQLNAIAKNYPLIGTVAADGAYGDATAQAVKTFQRIFDLPVTGQVNFPTWYKISDVFVAVKNLA